MQLLNHAAREGERGRALTDEGPDEADDVLREVEEREVVEPPRLRPEPLRRPGPRTSGNQSRSHTCGTRQSAARRER
jgi:hypothetical protein